MNKIYIFSLYLTVALSVAASSAAELSFLPKRDKPLSAETLLYSQMLHIGSQDNTLYMRGRFGTDYRLAGLTIDTAHYYDLGISASVDINMLPRRMIFAVDNFYAVLAIYFSSKINETVSWRFYPVYHLSAHLADGHTKDILKSETRAISSEMVRGELYLQLLNHFEITPAYGLYYSTTRALNDLRQRADLTLLFKKSFHQHIETIALIRAEIVQYDIWHGGFDATAGVRFTKKQRATGLVLRYFNRPHRSYYVKEYEKGWGIELLLF